jgi:hypothetical protein
MPLSLCMKKTYQILLFSLVANAASAQDTPVAQALQVVQQISAEGQGNPEATAAWKTLSKAGGGELPTILRAMNGLHPVAKNYLYTAVRVIAEREGNKLPMQALEAFLADSQQEASARKLCYDLLVSRDVSVKERVLPNLLKDPSPTLRREAVQRLMLLGKVAKEADKARHYTEALQGAIEEEQVKEISAELEKLGKPVDLLKHFGFIANWHIMGPFHNKGRAGFAEKFPIEPPAPIKYDTLLHGDFGPLKWTKHTITDPMGLLNFNKALVEKKEVTAYAVTDFRVAKSQAAQIRLGTKDAWKVWLNGELLFERDEYHRGRTIDQYILPVTLRAGSNQVLVKCCQNEEVQTWTGEWQFQLRITDPNGDALTSQ